MRLPSKMASSRKFSPSNDKCKWQVFIKERETIRCIAAPLSHPTSWLQDLYSLLSHQVEQRSCPFSLRHGEGIGYPFQYSWAYLVAQTLKNPPAMQETWVRTLGQEDPLEKEMATYSHIFAWRIPWTEQSGRLQSMGSQRIGHD